MAGPRGPCKQSRGGGAAWKRLRFPLEGSECSGQWGCPGQARRSSFLLVLPALRGFLTPLFLVVPVARGGSRARDLSRCSDSARSVTHCATRAPRFHLTRGFPLLRFTLCVGGRCCRWSSFALFVSEAAPCLCACLEGRACPVGRKPPSVASASRGCILGLSLPCLLAPPESSSARSVVCCFSGSTTGSVASLLTSRGRVSLVAARSPISVDGRLGGRNGPSKAFSAGACWVTRGFPPRCSFLQSWLILCPWLTFT